MAPPPRERPPAPPARRRLDALPPEAVAAQLAALEAGELLALTRPLRPRLVPGEEPPAAAVAEGMVQMDAAELRELVQRFQARLAPASVACRGRSPRNHPR